MAAVVSSRTDGAVERPAGPALGAEARAAAFTALLEGATEHAVFTLDLRGRVTSWSASARDLFGWDEAGAVGRDGADVFTPEDRARGTPEAEVARALADGRAECDHWFLREDGSRFWGSGTLTPMRDPGGAVIGFVKLLRDRTEQHAERGRLASRAEVLESISDAFYALDGAGRFTYANARALELWGRRADEVLGRGFLEAFPQAAGSETYAAHRRAVAEGRAAHVEHLSPVLGRWLSVSVYPAAGGGLAVYFRDVTEAKRAEAELQEARRFAQRVADISPAVVYVFDHVEQRNVYVNREVETVLGYTPAQITALGAGLLGRLVHPDDLPGLAAQVERVRALKDGETAEWEYRMRRADGAWRWFLGRDAVFARDARGAVAQVVGAAVDITDRRTAEEALRASEERHRLAMRAVEAMVFDWDVPADKVTRSEGLRRLLGFGPDEVEPTADWWRSRVHPDDARERGRPAEQAMARGAERFEVECRVRHRDGRWIDVLDTGYVLYGDDGRPVRAVGSSVDVTERRRAEAALRMSEERFRRFAEHSADVLWIAGAGAEGVVRLEYLSPAYERVWGEPREAVVRDLAHWAERVHPDDREKALRGLPRLLAKEVYVQEYRIVRPDGGVRWIRDTGFPIPDPDGTVRRVGGVAQDVTEVKEHERRQAVLVAELQHRVKNILANVQALARQTRARSRTLDGFADAFEGRLDALARAQKLLTRTPESRAGLREIVEGEITVHDGDGSRARVRGPDVTLGAGKAQSLQLAVHELATNAAKHGAFATAAGRVEVAWEIEPDPDGPPGSRLLRLRWRETGVPIADLAPPRGFGSEIIEGSLPYMLGGTASLAFNPDGAESVVTFPLGRKEEDRKGEP